MTEPRWLLVVAIACTVLTIVVILVGFWWWALVGMAPEVQVAWLVTGSLSGLTAAISFGVLADV